MAVTLAQAKVGMKNKVSAGLVEIFRNETVLFDMLPFDNAVAAAGKGSTLAYGYVCETLPAVAQSRSINEEYTGDQATKTEVVVNLKILGNKYSIDRVIAETGGTGFMDEVEFQSKAIAKGVVNRFLYLFINGNATSDAEQFDGLAVLLGETNNFEAELSALTGGMTADDAELICEAIDEAESALIRKPDIIIADSATLNRIKAAARKLGYFKQERDEFGRKVDYYDGIPLIDAGKHYTKAGTPAAVTATSIVGANTLYLVCLGMDGVHGVSPTSNDAFISTRLPDYSTAGAVKDGDVEMVTCIALKNKNAAAKVTLTQAEAAGDGGEA